MAPVFCPLCTSNGFPRARRCGVWLAAAGIGATVGRAPVRFIDAKRQQKAARPAKLKPWFPRGGTVPALGMDFQPGPGGGQSRMDFGRFF